MSEKEADSIHSQSHSRWTLHDKVQAPSTDGDEEELIFQALGVLQREFWPCVQRLTT